MSDPFSDAIVKIIGYGEDAYPNSHEIPLDPGVRHRVGQIFEFADSLELNWTELDLAGAGEWAKTQIADQFPFLSSDALNALAWSCTFGWK